MKENNYCPNSNKPIKEKVGFKPDSVEHKNFRAKCSECGQLVAINWGARVEAFKLRLHLLADKKAVKATTKSKTDAEKKAKPVAEPEAKPAPKPVNGKGSTPDKAVIPSAVVVRGLKTKAVKSVEVIKDEEEKPEAVIAKGAKSATFQRTPGLKAKPGAVPGKGSRGQ
jgi:hypothetical protein